ncbi:MAG: hypothetical protein ACLSB9_35990 [Hydrogeniiclostridium mannosilyticum]
MNVQDDYLFVRFDKYCKTCKQRVAGGKRTAPATMSGASSKPAPA